ncbi:MAG: GNAT family N-acetyltransferase, partial [Vicinamibacterales bacterium]
CAAGRRCHPRSPNCVVYPRRRHPTADPATLERGYPGGWRLAIIEPGNREGLTMQVTLKPRSAITPAEMEELYALDDAVYPHGGLGGPPGMERVVWADPEWDIVVRDASGLAVSHAGILERNALLDGQPLRIAGIAEVLTHPAHQRRGYGAAALGRAAEFMRDELRSPFAFLVCPEEAIPFYTRVGWQPFTGVVVTEFDGERQPFPYGPAMVLPLQTAAPVSGLLDLQGIPW